MATEYAKLQALNQAMRALIPVANEYNELSLTLRVLMSMIAGRGPSDELDWLNRRLETVASQGSVAAEESLRLFQEYSNRKSTTGTTQGVAAGLEASVGQLQQERTLLQTVEQRGLAGKAGGKSRKQREIEAIQGRIAEIERNQATFTAGFPTLAVAIAAWRQIEEENRILETQLSPILQITKSISVWKPYNTRVSWIYWDSPPPELSGLLSTITDDLVKQLFAWKKQKEEARRAAEAAAAAAEEEARRVAAAKEEARRAAQAKQAAEDAEEEARERAYRAEQAEKREAKARADYARWEARQEAEYKAQREAREEQSRRGRAAPHNGFGAGAPPPPPRSAPPPQASAKEIKTRECEAFLTQQGIIKSDKTYDKKAFARKLKELVGTGNKSLEMKVRDCWSALRDATYFNSWKENTQFSEFAHRGGKRRSKTSKAKRRMGTRKH